ncbi:type II secretion system F family protein [Limimaricola litoreus]|uniref:Type II secretion system F family protein n=1 Tax=Limimaricola litoreus TaxID=2955316 RepID=A0A9X2FRX2_9RHOB|nr:type II secretion system F family protein [Limimaricola litoreus]MCP1167076.1 type II secretion system F family protein [Limimaricola litoreus]
MLLLQQIEARLVALLGPAGPLLAVAFLGLAMVVIALPMLLRRRADPLDRLRAANARPETAEAKASPDRLRSASGADKLERYASFLEPQNAEEYSAARLRLIQAGYRTRAAVRIYHFSQFALGLAGLIGGLIYTLSQGGATTQELLLSTLLPGAIGYMAPKYWVTRRRETRRQNITDGFPDSLDMMLVCVEAGQSLDQSVIRVSHELRAGYPDLAFEYSQVAHEMKAGKDKTQVLRDLSERCGVSDISSFVTVLVQSQQFGTSIAEALRVFSAEMRDKRVMRAEEKANTLPTKMTLATMMLTVPPLLIILIGPSLYDIYMTIGGGAAGN